MRNAWLKTVVNFEQYCNFHGIGVKMHVIRLQVIEDQMAACKESRVRQPVASGFFDRASKFCA